MRPISLSSVNCHSSCRSRSRPVPAVAATFAQASAALTETEPLGRFAGRRGLGKRDSRPLREAVGELVAAVPFSLKPVHGLTCPGCGPRKRTNRRPLTSSRPRSRATCTPARTGTPRASALPCAGAGAGGHYQEGASRWERALVRRTPRSAATGASPVPASAGGHRSPQRTCPRRARPTPADCRPDGPASRSLRAAAHRGRATGHHRR